MRPRVGVIDSSASIRETVAIVLHDCAVEGWLPNLAPAELAAALPLDLLIIEDGILSSAIRQALPVETPVLWLRDPRLPAWQSEQQASLPRPFSPTQLQREVERLLQPRSAATAVPTDLLAAPALPADAAQLANLAAQTTLPILLCGEPGTGKLRVARAIHTRSGAANFVLLAAADCDHHLQPRLAETSADRTTLFVNDIESVGGDGQQRLLDIIDAGGVWVASTWHPVRVLCATSQSLDQLSESPSFDRDLLYRLSVFTIRLPALRDRTRELPSIVETVGRQLGTRLGVAPAQFTSAALQRLTRYLWFGNLAELETVLARSMALNPHRPLDTDDLLFGYARSAALPAAPAASAQATATTTPADASGIPSAVDVLINELAHEFKNPMVTIKTISSHLERLLADESGRQHVAQLAGEAIDRMDRALENLIQFTRFQSPVAQPASINGLLAPCLTELAPLLSERHVVLNYQPPEPIAAHVDSEQLVYALGNLLRTIVRDLEEGATLTIRSADPAPAIRIEFVDPSAAVAERLSRYSDTPSSSTEPALPLGFLFARSLIERNGGTVLLIVHDGVKTVTIQLPRHEGIELAHGKA